MTWLKTDLLLKRRLKHHGLDELVEAGLLCRKAEELLPGLFTAISVRNNCLHLATERKNIMTIKLAQGKLIEQLNQFAEQQKLGKITKIRLTSSE